MKIVINKINNEYLETVDSENIEYIFKFLKKFSSIKVPLEAKLIAINEYISSHELSKLKNYFDKINNFSCRNNF